MKIKSRILRMFTFVLIVISALMLFASCKPNDEDNVSLNINKDSVCMLLYQTDALTVDYNGADEVIWSVSNEDIISVEDGLITAKAVGDAIVTVSAGDLFDSCTVTVSPLDEEKFEIVINDVNISIYNGDTHNIIPDLCYDGISFSDVNYEYSSTDESIASVNANGQITVKKLGAVSIIVKATYYDFKFNSAVSVNVVSPYSIALNTDEINLFAKGEDSQTKAIIEATAKNREKNIDGVNFFYSAIDSLQDVINISSNGEITAMNAGAAFVKVSAQIEGELCESVVLVNVLPVTNTLNNNDIFVDLSEDVFTINYSSLGVVGDVVGAYVSDNGVNTKVEVTNNGLIFNNINAGEKSLVLQTRNENYIVSADFWTAVIDDAEELKCLYNATNGKYRLNADIDLSLIDWKYQNLYGTFTGLFDGANHTITGLTITGIHGLFGNVGNGAVVKDLNLNAKMVDTSEYTGALFSSINEGATVTVDNVDVVVFDSGKLNGGLTGVVNSKAKLNVSSANVLFYSVYGGIASGSITARCTGDVLLEDVKIYSSANVCGLDNVEGNSVKTAESINDLAIEQNIVVKPIELDKLNVNLDSTTNSDSEISKGNYFLNLPDDIQIGNVQNYYMFNQVMNVGEFGQNNSYLVKKSDIYNIVGGTVELYFIDDNSNVYYFSHKLFSELYIYQDNIGELTKISSGKVLIKEDIDLSGYTNWTSNATFTGEIDGEGHIIKNLKVDGNNSFGLFYNFGGKIKNIIFVDANVGNNAGILAYQLTNKSNVVIENVFVHQITGAYGSSTFTGGFIARINNNTSTITLKDVIYSAQETEAKNGEFGFVSGFGTALVNLENCYFIGGQNKAVGERENFQTNVQGEYKYFVNEIDFYEESSKQESSVVLTDLLRKGIQNGIRIFEITNENVEVLLSATAGYYFLGENIDMSGKSWAPSNKFAGILDGKGYSISNLKASNDCGLFGSLNGATIKNIAMIDVDTSNAGGVFGYRVFSNSTIENVFVSQKNIHTWYGGGLLRIHDGACTLTLKNVVMVMKTGTTVYTGFIAGRSAQKVVLDNCYFIGGNGQLVGTNASYNGGTISGEPKIYGSVDQFKSDSTKTLTEFLTSKVSTIA